MKKLFLMLSLVVFTLLAAACGGGGSSSNKDIFTDENEIVKIMQQLQDKEGFKGKELKVFQDVTMSSGKDFGGNFITIDILKPGTEDVDEYTYRSGSWDNGQPVQITGDGNMEDNVILLKDLHFEKLPLIYKTFEEKVKDKEGVKVKHQVTYRFWRGNWTVMMDAESERAKYSAEFDLNGNLIEFEKR